MYIRPGGRAKLDKTGIGTNVTPGLFSKLDLIRADLHRQHLCPLLLRRMYINHRSGTSLEVLVVVQRSERWVGLSREMLAKAPRPGRRWAVSWEGSVAVMREGNNTRSNSTCNNSMHSNTPPISRPNKARVQRIIERWRPAFRDEATP
jgi:hypothetical protein